MTPLTGMSHAPHGDGNSGLVADALLVTMAVLAVAAYTAAVVASRGRGRAWPARRMLSWWAGIACAAAAVIGPLAHAGHDDFVAHMWAHLLGGMVAPLLLVLAAPGTLALRALPVASARRFSRLLRSAPMRFIAHPVTALVLSAGGLWLIYLTPVFAWMQSSGAGHAVVHAHLLAAGYVFTAAVIGLDPAPHAPGRMMAAAVLLASMASHSILAKHLYANPPLGISVAQAQEGAQLMYYAGAGVDAVIITVLCAQWFRGTKGPVYAAGSGRRDSGRRARRAVPDEGTISCAARPGDPRRMRGGSGARNRPA